MISAPSFGSSLPASSAPWRPVREDLVRLKRQHLPSSKDPPPGSVLLVQMVVEEAVFVSLPHTPQHTAAVHLSNLEPVEPFEKDDLTVVPRTDFYRAPRESCAVCSECGHVPRSTSYAGTPGPIEYGLDAQGNVVHPNDTTAVRHLRVGGAVRSFP